MAAALKKLTSVLSMNVATTLPAVMPLRAYYRTWSAAIGKPIPIQVREEFSKYLSSQHCPDCQGTRLRRDARHVFIDKHALPEITAMTIAGAAAYFNSLKFRGKKASIAEKILKEI